MFAVVYFSEENTLDVVPRSWLSSKKDGTKECYWPKKGLYKGTSFTKAVEKGTPPSPDWDLFKVDVLKQTDNLIHARRKCLKASEAANVLSVNMDTTDLDEKRKSRCPSRLDGETDADSDDTTTSIDQSVPKRMKKNNAPLPSPTVPDMPTASTPTCTIVHSSAAGSIASDMPAGATADENYIATKVMTPSTGTTARRNLALSADKQSGFRISKSQFASPVPLPDMNTLQDENDGRSDSMLLQRIFVQMRQNTALLQSIHRRMVEGQAPTMTTLEDFRLPLQNMEDFSSLETILEEKSKFQGLVSHLASIGGFNRREVVANMMLQVMATSLAKTFNWKGKGLKNALDGTLLSKAVLDAGKKASLKEMETVKEIQRWLKNANDRDGGRGRRLEKKLVTEKQSAACEQLLSAMNSDTDSN